MNLGTVLIPGSRLIDNYLSDTTNIFDRLIDIDYDKSMKSRWTASFGKAYDYSGNVYPDTTLPDFLNDIANLISPLVGFTPNNCLINRYHDGKSSMGYHSDNIDNLLPGTGVVIISIGSSRTLRFKNKLNSDIIDYVLNDGSIFYMNDIVQNLWLHSIPKSDTSDVRFSLTFRNLI